MLQRREVTRAVMCDTQPPCLTELLFTHEFWSGSSETRSRCRSRKYDSDWPTVEPHVNRRKQRPRPRSFWETMRLLPNKTLWLHGDSVQTQLCDAALCSLLRADALPWPALHRPQWLQALELESGLSMRLTQRMPNGAALLCSAFGPHKTEQVSCRVVAVATGEAGSLVQNSERPRVRACASEHAHALVTRPCPRHGSRADTNRHFSPLPTSACAGGRGTASR
eukprot:6188809-Pleurochrysis_carterae.AAC.2